MLYSQYEGSRARLGMKECLAHNLFSQYPVLEEKEGDFVAHAKFTVLVTEEGAQRVTGGFLPQSNVTPETACADEELMGYYSAAVAKAEAKAAKKKKVCDQRFLCCMFCVVAVCFVWLV